MIVVVLLLFVFSIFPSHAIGARGGTPGHISNPSPWCGEQDVTITDKGVQTCINVTVDQDCTVNLTFEWFNVTQYHIDWLEWFINWPYGGIMPTFHDDIYWFTYGENNNINISGQYCFYNENVTCATGGSWLEWQDWRVTANFTCYGNFTYTEIFYCYYMPELCPLFYIYPSWNATSVCPCCDAMCVGISNADGHSMNITIYRNDSQFETFYIINKYNYVGNKTYCFCIDGHIDDNVYYPMKYNETYYWYVNITDTTTGEYEISDTYQFTTAENISYCPCGIENIGKQTIIIREHNIVLFLLILCVVLTVGLFAYKKYK